MRHIFIVNPLAGGGKSLKIVKNIARVCENQGLDYVIHYTEAPMDATRIAERYKECQCVIYSVGGDGTMNEVLNGIVGSKNLFAVIPAGSGNDFTRTLNSLDKLVLSSDVGKINDRYFINVACIGIDGEVAANANRIMKHMKIHPSQIYNISIIYTFIKYKFKNLQCTIGDFFKRDKFTMFAICNGRYYGGGFQIAPKADISDGVFDIYFVSKISKLKIPYLFLKLIKGQHENIEGVNKLQSDFVIIKSQEDIVCNVDGESMIGKEFNIRVVKNAVTLYNNKEMIKQFLTLEEEGYCKEIKQAN